MKSICLLLLALVMVVNATQQLDPDSEFLLGEQRGLSMPDFVVDGDLEVGGKIMESCSVGDKNARWKGSTGNKHCYMFFQEPRSWYKSKQHCEAIGGYLATITSDEEQAFLTSRFQFADTTVWDDWLGPWIGYSDGMSKGQWQWVNGEIAVMGQDQVYSNWYANEPDNCCGGEDCAQISGGHWGDKWNDNKCNMLLPYICERNK